ncbi:MAG TPA: MtnX-like HAD-IB family phosphatase [Candidatus Kapabacteria bacterium]|jgi:2,3-diketo-5-methylthio-1-phosphopentane phosphatase|nr:MtnX-like HAD-IB family phosphatase [Candidatus Kapabacteria bacterium]
MYKVYCDFDETITMRDVGRQIIGRFGASLSEEIWKDFDAGIRSAAECLRIECSSVQGANREAIDAIIQAQALRPGFAEFAVFCQERNIELYIVSDGFSIYIRPLLEQNGLSHIPIWTNTIELKNDGSLDINFEHQREGCTRCASCKCARILTSSEDSDTVVYIGDGYSDWCPSSMSDVVFARRDLKRQCTELGIPHHPFEDFHEVQAILSNYLKDRPKYRREQAHRKRKELITIE